MFKKVDETIQKYTELYVYKNDYYKATIRLIKDDNGKRKRTDIKLEPRDSVLLQPFIERNSHGTYSLKYSAVTYFEQDEIDSVKNYLDIARKSINDIEKIYFDMSAEMH